MGCAGADGSVCGVGFAAGVCGCEAEELGNGVALSWAMATPAISAPDKMQSRIRFINNLPRSKTDGEIGAMARNVLRYLMLIEPGAVALDPETQSADKRQPGALSWHQSCMKSTSLRSVSLITLALVLGSITACTTKDNPDEIRQRTAEATQTMRRDAKAVAEGVKEGMRSDKAIDVNTASRDELLSLPGMTERDADRIIAERPFKDAHELVARRLISEAEYDKISDRIIAGR